MRDLSYYKPQVQRISKKIQELKNKDKHFKVFGAKDHKYVLQNPISFEELEKIEKKYKIYLPDEYVAFITCLGNGGAGPDYGLYSLQKAIDETDKDTDISKTSLFTSNKRLKEFMDKNNKVSGADEQFCDFSKVFNGTMEINTEGCTFRNNIILNGCNAGKVIAICWDTIEEEIETFNCKKELVNFLDWYEKWLDDSTKNLKNK